VIFGSRGDAEARRRLGLRDIEQISGDVLDAAIKLHKALGPGLLETVYEMVLAARLVSMGYRVERQKPVDIVFEEMRFEAAFRIDLLVDGRLIIEIKSVNELNLGHHKQLLTYLRLTEQPVGLLINFGGAKLMDGFKRVVNDYKPSASPRLRVNQKEGKQ
jgi:GxxExxY protein